ncbi:Cysteine and histidine-rich protein 1 [Folsomia candida]|uniref:Cysteine and histidine-rich protein 1 n=1 Tax=Folsomia candida TaxID=158441 RepID=A0A226F6T7_FOLCA|nr:Cysteine and histidine-rich protein 1 [Folsomia candida]
MEGGSSSSSGSTSTSTSQLFVQMEASSAEISSSDNNAPSTSSSSMGNTVVGPSPSATTSSVAAVAESLAAAVEHSMTGGDDHEPCKKKPRVHVGGSAVEGGTTTGAGVTKLRPEKLEHRLGGILCCAVCLDLPKSAIYQCTNGHLMCAGCFTHLLADARLRDEIATCPNCRVEISKHMASRNLAVEKAVNELPSECQFCNKEFPRNSLDHHEKEECEESRTSICKYQRIGCPWRGPFHELLLHQENCIHPKKSGGEVMEILGEFDKELEKERKLYHNIFDLLNYEKITFNDLQLKPYRTDEFVHKLYYETSRFSAFNNQLILKTKPSSNLDVSFVVLKGPFGDMKVNPSINRFEFSEQNNESPYFHLPINESSEVNRLLSQKAVHFRLIAFLQ